MWLTLILALLLVAGCKSEEPTATPQLEPTAAGEVTPAVALVLAGPSQTQSLTMDEIQALPAAEGWGGIKTSTGDIVLPARFKGVLLQELCALVGGLGPNMGVNIIAEDGYAMTFSSEQILNNEFITYDPATGDEVTVTDPLQVVIAYERDGQPLPQDSDGTLRLVVLTPKNNQVVDGHWSVKWIKEIHIKAMAQEWTLHLQGALIEEMDRGTFESCAAANCHQATWTDADGQVWTGVPLWLLAGRLDDDNRHGDYAYNQALADQGYTLDVVAADGYTVSFESARFNRNTDILIAHLMNGEPLPEKHFPLRVVGAGLQKNEMVSQVAQLIAHLPAGAETAPIATEPAVEWSLQLEGALTEAVDQPSFEACANCHAATWTDDSGQVWKGVPLWRLAGRVDDDSQHGGGAYNQELADQGYTLDAVAADGYTVSLESARFNRDDNILVAYLADDQPLLEKHFPLRLVGAGLQKSEMVGQLARLLIHLPAPVAEAPAGEAALAITGAVEQEQALSLDALQGMEVVEVSAEHPKQGMQTNQGILLNALLDLAGVKPEATKLVIVASDGYTAELSLTDARACAECLVAFTNEGTLKMVMPGMESNLWVKDVIKLEVQ